MQNRYKQYREQYESYQDNSKGTYQQTSKSPNAVTSISPEASVKKDPSTAFFRSAQLLNMIIDQIKGFEKKLPIRDDGTPFLNSPELETTIVNLEKLAKHYNKKPSDNQTHGYAKRILARLDTYQTFLNEYVEVSPQLDTIIADVTSHIQKVRKELRYV